MRGGYGCGVRRMFVLLIDLFYFCSLIRSPVGYCHVCSFGYQLVSDIIIILCEDVNLVGCQILFMFWEEQDFSIFSRISTGAST